MQMRKEMKKERRRVRREWCGKNWKWVVPCIVAGLILAIVMCCLSIPLLVSRVKQQLKINELKECSGNSISKYITELVIPSNRCNSEMISTLDLSLFPQLNSVEIGDDCFMNVGQLNLIGLSKLQTVVIGMNSFTKVKNDGGSDPNRHFYLKNCERLRELKIGRYSFRDYSVCEIENVPSLEVIEMGELNEYSYNFYYASLELKSDSERMR